MAYAPAEPPRDVSWYGDPRKHGARCDLCPLAGSPVVPHEAPRSGKLRLVLVGEGPGRREEILRTPFTGPTGKLLDEALENVGLSRSDSYVTNAALCAGENDQDNARAAECCAPRLLRELTALPAEVPTVLLGKAATRSVLGVNSILLARGFVWTARELSASVKNAEAALRKAKTEEDVTAATLRVDVLTERNKLAGRVIFPTLHPTFAFIHNENWSALFNIDLDRVARFVRGEFGLDDLIDRIERVHSLKELRARKRVFVTTDNPDEIRAASKILGPEVACDIETERLKPLTPLLARILTVQLSDGDRSIVIGPWDPAKHPAVLSEFLRGRTVVFHNGYCFDQIAMARDGVSFEGVQLEDTLTAHHTFASCYPQKLDHVVSTFTDCGPWKIRFGVRGAEEKGLAPQHVEDNELELYGAVDGVVTILAWRALQRDLEPERAVYEHDKRRSLFYREIQVNGYKIDKRRQRMLSKALKRRAAGLKGKLRRIARRPNFQPSKLGDVRKVLFKVLKAPLINPTPTGLAGTSNATLETLRTGGTGEKTRDTRVARFSETLLDWRVTVKVKGTYIDPVQVHPDGRAHYNFKPFGVLTGRPASRILSAPRWSRSLVERVRELYVADVGCDLVYFDLAQAEGRFAANLSADPLFIEACAVDLHTRNALILFTRPEQQERLKRDPKGKYCPRHSEKGSAKAACNCGKPLRDVTKNVGFAIIYQAGPAKVLAFLRSQGFDVDMAQVEAMFAAMRMAYAVYNGYVQNNIRFVERNGYLRTAIKGRLMRLGFHPEPAQVANVPIQSGIGDVMDTRLMDEILPRVRPTGAKMVIHHYDSATFDTPRRHVDKVRSVIDEVWKAPIALKKSIVCREDISFVLPAESKMGKRWSDF